MPHYPPVKTALLLLCLSLNLTIWGQSIAQCDSLIAKGVDAMWKNDHAHSLEYLTEARNMAVKNHWYKQEFLAINNIGANYYTMLDYGEALNSYLESYTLAVKKLEPVNEMVVLNNIAILYGKEKNYDKATEYFTKAYNIARENNDKIKIGLYAMNLGSVANETGELDVASKYINESLPYLKQDIDMYLLAQAALADNLLLRGKYTEARVMAQDILKQTKNPGFNDLGTTLNFVIAKSYKKEGNFKEAIATVTKMAKANPAADTKRELFNLMADIYAADKDYLKALQYKDSILFAEKEINRVKNGELYETNKVKFELQGYKNQIAINNEKLKAERTLFYYLGGGVLAVLTIIILIARNISVKNKQKQLLAERNEKAMALELEREKNEKLELERSIASKESIARLEQERLKNEIEARNRELSAKALYLSGRNQLIEDVVESLSQSPSLAGNPALTQHIRSLKSHVKNNDEWDSFLNHFEEVNHGLLEKLKVKHPSLTANDLRFIAYIYMNLSNKEIAAMLNITPEACRKRKERLATKMELPADTSLYDYLSFI